MRISRFAPLVLLALIGCHQSGLFAPGSLDGEWEWQFNRNPSGSSISFSLLTAGAELTGSGTLCGVGPAACSPGSVTVTGHSTGVAVRLTIQGGGGFVATYSAELIAANELSGTWTQGNASNPVIFYRQ